MTEKNMTDENTWDMAKYLLGPAIAILGAGIAGASVGYSRSSGTPMPKGLEYALLCSSPIIGGSIAAKITSNVDLSPKDKRIEAIGGFAYGGIFLSMVTAIGYIVGYNSAR